MAQPTLDPNSQTLSGILVGLIVLGIALLVANVPSSPLRSSSLELFVVFGLPLAIALVAYVRFTRSVVWWEVLLLAVWGLVSIVVVAFVGFLATVGSSGGYPGAGIELLENLATFLAVTLGLGVPYGVAGTFRRDNPERTVVSVVLAPIFLFVLLNVVTAVV